MDRSLIKSADLECVGLASFPLFMPVKTAIRPSATMCQALKRLYQLLTCHAGLDKEMISFSQATEVNMKNVCVIAILKKIYIFLDWINCCLVLLK